MTFANIERMVVELLPILPEGKSGTVGDFTYETNGRNIGFSRGGSVWAWLNFDYPPPTAEKFKNLTVLTGGESYCILPGGLRREDDDREEHPRLSTLDWGLDGKLMYLRIDLCDGFANYGPMNECLRTGESPDLLALPDSLIGHDEILGLKVPWLVDMGSELKWLVEESGLEGFVQTLKTRGGR